MNQKLLVLDDTEDFSNHSFKISKVQAIDNIKESIRQNGILVHTLVRPK